MKIYSWIRPRIHGSKNKRVVFKVFACPITLCDFIWSTILIEHTVVQVIYILHNADHFQHAPQVPILFHLIRLENQLEETWDGWSITVNNGLPFIFHSYCCMVKQLSTGTVLKNALGGAFEDTPAVGCQKVLHSWAMMADTEAQQTYKQDNTSWGSFCEKFAVEQNHQVSKHQKLCFRQSVQAAASPCNDRTSLKRAKGHLLSRLCMSNGCLQANFSVIIV